MALAVLSFAGGAYPFFLTTAGVDPDFLVVVSVLVSFDSEDLPVVLLSVVVLVLSEDEGDVVVFSFFLVSDDVVEASDF